ncbi:hypothetical protein CTheo_5618 [Ceratobasidium theobromae]|uniref:Peptidase C14 caspase domain-containing protein n=1 Tax=Ceratobasidium theobromae TaxID=1582974 RepID=A0A5N5QGX2_9AGAM|nr:hypothetical protein CTheo_5618 [Ceratobasidium theobromae]
MNYYTRRNSRRATVDGAIGDNWVELAVPELAIAASAPAIDSVPGGRIGAHFSRIGLAWSNAVPHGVPQTSALLHAQMTRRGTVPSAAPSSSAAWPRVLRDERRESSRTLGAFALAHSVATVIAFAPNPGSPPPSKQPTTTTRRRWYSVLPGEPAEPVKRNNDPTTNDAHSDTSSTIGSDSCFSPYDGTNTPASEIVRTPPAASILHPKLPHLFVPAPNTIQPMQRSATFPPPSQHLHEAIPDQGQIIMIGPRTTLYDSPVPLITTSCTTPTRTSAQDKSTSTNTSVQLARRIIEGIGNLFDVVERQKSIDGLSTPSPSMDAHNNPRRSQVFQSAVDEWDFCAVTPSTGSNPARESWHTADTRERKLLIIGSSYNSENFRRATADTNATLGSLLGVSHDVKSLSSVFKKRSYTVETLVGESFDAKTVLERVAEFLKDALEGDVRAIIFTGHAARTHRDGTVAIVPPVAAEEEDDGSDEGWIRADVWESTVRRNTRAGVIVLSVFASCMSGDLMHQRVNLRDLNNSQVPEAPTTPDAPIFITFASSAPDQSTYESIVDARDRNNPRYGDHFLRAFTLAARDRDVTDWQSFIRVLEEKFEQFRKIGAFCAAHDLDPNYRNSRWLETHPQNPIYSSSQQHLPALQDIIPWDLVDPPTPAMPFGRIDLAEEFLAHIALRGETPEITHFTYANAQ